jgi:hypothetical protein
MNRIHSNALCAPIVYSLRDMPVEQHAQREFLADLCAQAYKDNQKPPCRIGDLVGPTPGLVVRDASGVVFDEQELGIRPVIGMGLCLYQIKTPPEALCIEFVGWTLILEGVPFPVRACGFMRVVS